MSDFPWPDSKRCAVALTFDMDGETVPFVLDPPNARRRLSLISEAMYDGRVGTPRILDVLDNYKLKSTFFVPGFTAELNVKLLKDVVARGHTLGMTMHPFVTGRPSRIILLERLIDYMKSFDGVWFTTLEEIAAYCAKGGHGEMFRYPPEIVG